MCKNVNLQERLNKAFGYLVGEGIVKTKTDVAIKMGSSQPNVSSAFNGNPKFLTNNFVLRFNKAFDRVFSDDWLLSGTGTMLREKLPPSHTQSAKPNAANELPVAEQAATSPYFDTSTVEGGKGIGFGDEMFSPQSAAGLISAPGLKVGPDIPYIQVHGDSMLNRNNPERSLPNGCWIGLQRCTSSVIQWGEVYAFMTTDGPIVKKLQPSEIDGCVKCVSFNTEDDFKPFDLPTNEIIGPLHRIVGVLTVTKW